MGGMKASGLGRRHGREGLLKYTEPQTIAVRSKLAERLTDPGDDAAGYAKRFTSMLRVAKHLRAGPQDVAGQLHRPRWRASSS